MRYEKETRPFLRIDTRHNHLIFNRATHDLLGKPTFFMFYWRSDMNALYVAPQWEEVRHSFAIPPNSLKNRSLEIICQRMYLFSNLRKRMGWKPGCLYKVFGEYDSAVKMVCFRLEEIQALEVTV